jgi:hypothetical protein
MTQILNKIEQRLSNIESKLNKDSSNWLNLKEAVDYTRLGSTTLRKSIYSGELRSSRKTGKILFRRHWLDKFLMYRKQRLSSIEQAEFKTELQDG